MITRRSSRRLESISASKDERCQLDARKGKVEEIGDASGVEKTDKKTRAKKAPNQLKTTPPKPKAPPAKTKTTKGRQSAKRKLDKAELESEKQSDDQPEKLQTYKKLKYDPIKFNSDATDPVIEHLKKIYINEIDSDKHVNLESEIVDQIALEGLSGITLSKLFQILDALHPDLKCTQDEKSANFIWSVLLYKYLHYPPGCDVQVHYVDPTLIQSTDEPAILEGRNVITEKQILLPSQTLKRFVNSDPFLYPVQEGLIMGSCKNYLIRMNITEEVLKLIDEGSSMHELNSKYGMDNVYFVACQALRTKAVIPDWADPNIDIKLREYCALELIGKSRTLGTVFPNDKTLGRYRIMLLAKGFITQYQETSSSPIEHHLRRFSRKRLIPPFKAERPSSSKSSGKEAASGSDDDERNLERPLSSYCCDPGKLKADRSILSMVYDVIAESDGLIQLEVRRKLKLPKFHLRNHIKNLVSIEMIYSSTSKSDSEKAGFRIFKTAHKSAKRRKLRDELAKPTGIMASWDEPDLRAKRIIGHKRSSFSKAEDSLLILCRITSILIEPSLKLSWCVHKRIVRDLLHKELVESHDKTSDACLRRIKYLKRLPNNIMSINELTAELRDDPDIRRLIPNKINSNNEKLNKLFVQVLKFVRTKIPDLLGITSSSSVSTKTSSSSSSSSRTTGSSRISNQACGSKITAARSLRDGSREKDRCFEIGDYADLKEKYELIDCQSVASISRAPTYEKPKNVVDVKFNNACLVTMAFILNYSFQTKEERKLRRESNWLLDKFYSNYHDKLISGVLSKLNKRSLLTRKCSADQASLYKPNTRLSFKLNQSVLFLLSRHQSHSLMQLAHAISQTYQINLSENNEMASIALLTSFCSSSSFNLDMELKIPPNVVGIDQGNENFRSLCERANEATREILSRFMSRCGGSLKVGPRTATEAVKFDSTDETDVEATFMPSTSKAQLASSSTAAGKLTKNDNDHKNAPRDESSAASTPEITSQTSNKMDDSRRALFLLRHELRAHSLDKCGSLADCLIVQPCNIKFSSNQKLELKKGPMDAFLNQPNPLEIMDAGGEQQQQNTNWLVKSFKLPRTTSDHNRNPDDDERDLDSVKMVPVEYQARLWKSIDGSVHAPTLFKLIESLLSWVIVFPGVERQTLLAEFSHLMPDEHLHELLDLMESLELISSLKVKGPRKRPRLFGYQQLDGPLAPVVSYEPSPDAYVIYCQLLNYCK